jgi:hypothetical protein
MADVRHFIGASKSWMKAVVLLCITIPMQIFAADNANIVQADWSTRTASCSAKITQSTQATFRVTDINDLIIDFNTGQRLEYQFRAKGTPVSVVPPENLLGGLQTGLLAGCQNAANPGSSLDETAFVAQLEAVRRLKDPQITPTSAAHDIPLEVTRSAAHSHSEVRIVEAEYLNSTCSSLFNSHSADPVVQWIARLDAQMGVAGAAPPHSVDFTVNLQPDLNYHYTIQEYWKGAKVGGATLDWKCGENDVLTMSLGPLVTALPYRSYNHQKAPVPPGSSTTQDILVVGGDSNVNVLGAALLNYHFPQLPFLPDWTGLAVSVGPVYTLGNAPSVSHIGLFMGGSIHLYRSVFFSPGVHIGEFADFPANFGPGSVIPAGFGDLNPVKRNTVRFAMGITFKTTTFKKSSQNTGAAKNTGATTSTATGASQQQGTSGSHGTPGSGTHSSPPSTGTPDRGTGSGQPSAPPQPTPPSSNQGAEM